MSHAQAIGAAFLFTWFGMVVAISFLEAPLKFRAPGVTLEIGLGIGRLVFRALNIGEVILGAGVASTLIAGPWCWRIVVPAGVALAALFVQLTALRPALSRRTRAVLAGSGTSGSWAHHAYIALEGTKVVALLAAGILTLTLVRG
ncbi:MAG TPA: hypothetical protein VGG21_08790 [Acidimicrobiales bacterium]|jgi:hypothetical protein